MILKNVDVYHVREPLFEGVRVILLYLGEKYTPEYIQGISGAGFKIAGGCPSRPTCIFSMWTTDFIKYLGYEATEYPCFDANGNDITDKMIEAVKQQIDNGKPALVWNALTNSEWDVVCGYDEEQKQFIGRGTYKGTDDYDRDEWDRAKKCDSYPIGAIVIGNKIADFDERKAEINSLVEAVKHARTTVAVEDSIEGIQFYKKWADEYSREGKDRGVADAYCYDIYLSARKAVIGYLMEISPKYSDEASDLLLKAANWFKCETESLTIASPYLSWASPWGVDEDRSKKVAPILKEAADYYEKAMACIEKALTVI